MSAPTDTRSERLDALRGLAMAWMVAFHFCFDLNHYRLLLPVQDFYRDPFWTGQRTAIVSLFLFCAGLGQGAALQAGQGWPRFWRRWLQVAGCALLVSAGSALMFPRSWISFGVLHGIALMLLVTRGLGRWPPAALAALGLAALAAPLLWQHPFFDSRWTNWVGLTTRKPVTEDWVPLLPWLGVMLAGLLAWRSAAGAVPRWLAGPLPAPARPLARLGRWPLAVYMVHQPLLIGLVLGLRALKS